MNIISDDDLVKQLKQKNEQALEAVIDLYGGLVKSIVRKHLYQLESCQDECINDVLFAVWKNIDQYDKDRSSFKNWIAAISKYKSIDYKRKYYKLLLEQQIDETIIDKYDTEQQALRNELEEETESILMYLNPQDRTLFFEYYVQEKDINTLSREMEKKPSVLYNRLSRGRKRIKTKLNYFKE